MYTGLYHTHKTAIILFILIYLVKTILLVTGRKVSLSIFSKKILVPEIVISSLFLITGVWLLFETSEIRPLFMVKLAMVFIAVPTAMIGFRKQNMIMGVFSFLLVIGAYGVAEVNKRAMLKRLELPKEIVSDPSDSSYDILAHGQALYENQCIVCHGEDGNLQLSGAKSLSTSVITKEEVIQRIREGKLTMVAYENHLSSQEIEAVAKYVLTLRD